MLKLCSPASFKRSISKRIGTRLYACLYIYDPAACWRLTLTGSRAHSKAWYGTLFRPAFGIPTAIQHQADANAIPACSELPLLDVALSPAVPNLNLPAPARRQRQRHTNHSSLRLHKQSPSRYLVRGTRAGACCPRCRSTRSAGLRARELGCHPCNLATRRSASTSCFDARVAAHGTILGLICSFGDPR